MAAAVRDGDVPSTRRSATVRQLAAEDLKALGVDVVFGLMSEDTAEFVVALNSIGIPFSRTRHETNAIAMAEGYAFATNRLGVAVIGRGPASTNALTGSIHASRTGSKVLIVLGDGPVTDGAVNPLGRDLKGMSVFGAAGIYTAAGLRAFSVTTPGAARPLLAQAAAYAALGKAAVLLLPTTVQAASIEIETVRRPGAAMGRSRCRRSGRPARHSSRALRA